MEFVVNNEQNEVETFQINNQINNNNCSNKQLVDNNEQQGSPAISIDYHDKINQAQELTETESVPMDNTQLVQEVK